MKATLPSLARPSLPSWPCRRPRPTRPRPPVTVSSTWRPTPAAPATTPPTNMACGLAPITMCILRVGRSTACPSISAPKRRKGCRAAPADKAPTGRCRREGRPAPTGLTAMGRDTPSLPTGLMAIMGLVLPTLVRQAFHPVPMHSTPPRVLAFPERRALSLDPTADPPAAKPCKDQTARRRAVLTQQARLMTATSAASTGCTLPTVWAALAAPAQRPARMDPTAPMDPMRSTARPAPPLQVRRAKPPVPTASVFPSATALHPDRRRQAGRPALMVRRRLTAPAARQAG